MDWEPPPTHPVCQWRPLLANNPRHAFERHPKRLGAFITGTVNRRQRALDDPNELRGQLRALVRETAVLPGAGGSGNRVNGIGTERILACDQVVQHHADSVDI